MVNTLEQAAATSQRRLDSLRNGDYLKAWRNTGHRIEHNWLKITDRLGGDFLCQVISDNPTQRLMTGSIIRVKREEILTTLTRAEYNAVTTKF